jgi:hypothetical protein
LATKQPPQQESIVQLQLIIVALVLPFSNCHGNDLLYKKIKAISFKLAVTPKCKNNFMQEKKK